MVSVASHKDFDLLICEDGHFTINDIEIDDDGREQYWGLLDELSPRPICPYCKIKSESAVYRDQVDGNDVWHLNRIYQLMSCRNCGFWELNGSEAGNKCMDSSISLSAGSVAAKFTASMPPGCSADLAQLLRQNPDRWHSLSPRQLEMLVADIFKANHKSCEVLHVGKPGDHGIDVVFVDDGNCTWLIQVKGRTQKNRAEGFETLQRILGTLALTGNRYGVIATTADYFSNQVRAQLPVAAKQGFIVELVDKGKLTRMLNPLLPHRPWMNVIESQLLPDLDGAAIAFLNERVSSAAEPLLF